VRGGFNISNFVVGVFSRTFVLSGKEITIKSRFGNNDSNSKFKIQISVKSPLWLDSAAFVKAAINLTDVYYATVTGITRFWVCSVSNLELLE
jgi:hypothetical protein